MTDPIVTLPSDHWIVKAFKDWCQTLGVAAISSEAHAAWPAFAAGAQAIPGTPEKVAEAERALAEVQTDYRILTLERDSEELDEKQVGLEQRLATQQMEIDQLRQKLNLLEEHPYWGRVSELIDRVRRLEERYDHNQRTDGR